MKHLKYASIFLATLYLSIAITSNTYNSSSNQAYALGNSIDDSIKRACPNYEGTNGNINIQGLVTNILKSCIPTSSQPSPSPNPGPLSQNILQIKVVGPSAENGGTGTVIVTDTTTQDSSSFDMGGTVYNEFVIPIGDSYTVQVQPDNGALYSIDSTDCQSSGDNSCSGIMSNSIQSVVAYQ